MYISVFTQEGVTKEALKEAKGVLLKALKDAGPASYTRILSLPAHLAALESNYDKRTIGAENIEFEKIYRAIAFFLDVYSAYDVEDGILVFHRERTPYFSNYYKIFTNNANHDVISDDARNIILGSLSARGVSFRNILVNYAIRKLINNNTRAFGLALDLFLGCAIESEPPSYEEFQQIWNTLLPSKPITGYFGNLITDEDEYKQEVAKRKVLNFFSKDINQSKLPAGLDGLNTFGSEEIGKIVPADFIVDLEELKILCRDLAIAFDPTRFSAFFIAEDEKEKEVQRVEEAIKESADLRCVAEFDHYQKLYEGISQEMGTFSTDYTSFFQDLKTHLDTLYEESLESVSKENAETMHFVHQTIARVFNCKYIVKFDAIEQKFSFRFELIDHEPLDWNDFHEENLIAIAKQTFIRAYESLSKSNPPNLESDPFLPEIEKVPALLPKM